MWTVKTKHSHENVSVVVVVVVSGQVLLHINLYVYSIYAYASMHYTCTYLTLNEQLLIIIEPFQMKKLMVTVTYNYSYKWFVTGVAIPNRNKIVCSKDYQIVIIDLTK